MSALVPANMNIHSNDHHRRSIRLKNYEYAQAGAYFVTICTQNRECLFGEVKDGIMLLNDAGQMIERWWLELPSKFPALRLDCYVIMPNHLHGIICIEENVGPVRHQGAHIGAPLPMMVQWLKTMTTNEYIRGVNSGAFQPFDRRVWQRNYYEHIIRNEIELDTIRNYIVSNPLNWSDDELNPQTKQLMHSRVKS